MSRIGRGNKFAPDVPAISIAATASISEGQTLSVIITRPSSTYVSTCYVYTVANSAGLSDFSSLDGTLVTFGAGETSKTVTVPVMTDVINELDETFFVMASNPNNATINNNKCVVTILGNIIGDAPKPVFDVAFVSSPIAAEGANLVFTIGLTGTTQQPQVIPFTLAGTAIAGTDYATPFICSNGVTVTAGNFNVPIGVSSWTNTALTTPDTLSEVAKTVILTAGTQTGTGTISNVTPAVIQTMTITNTNEGGIMVVTVNLDKPAVAGQILPAPTLTGGV